MVILAGEHIYCSIGRQNSSLLDISPRLVNEYKHDHSESGIVVVVQYFYFVSLLLFKNAPEKTLSLFSTYTRIHTHTHTHTYIYIICTYKNLYMYIYIICTHSHLCIKYIYNKNILYAHTDLSIYLYIAIHKQIVTLYDNSSVLLETQDASNWDRNRCSLTEELFSYLPTYLPGYDTRSIFKRSLTGLNSEFSFS